MDPDATWARLNDGTCFFDERVQAAVDLASWLSKGGFLPTKSPLDRPALRSFCHGFIAAAAAVRSMPEVEQLRTDLTYIDKNTQHIVHSSVRLLEALSD